MSEMWRQAEAIAAAARSRGAADAEVLIVENHIVRYELGWDRASERDESRVSLRVFAADGRSGVAEAELGKGSVDALIGAALRGGGPVRRAAPRLDVPDRGLGILDARYAHLDERQRRAVVEQTMDDAASVDDRVVLQSIVYEEVLQSRTFASSAGGSHAERSTRYRLSAETAVRGGEHGAVRDSLTSRNFAEVASKPIGVELARRCVARETFVGLPETAGVIALAPRAVGALLPPMMRAFCADRLRSGSSFLHGQSGEQVGSQLLHIVDDALLSGGYATRSFDDRGVPPTAVNLLREGRLGGVYETVDDAAQTDSRPSGHETADGGLWLGNLVVRPGNRSRNMVFPDLGTVAVVDDLVDIITMDLREGVVEAEVAVGVFDGGDRVGFGGTHRVRWPLARLLSGVVHVLNDQERVGVVDTPTWVVDGLWFV